MSELVGWLKSLNPKTACDYPIYRNTKLVKFGRHGESDVLIEDARSSVYHAELLVDQTTETCSFTIRDTSSNGTFVRGALVGRNNVVEIFFNDTFVIIPQDRNNDNFVEFQLAHPYKRNDELETPMKRSAMNADVSNEMHCPLCLELICQPVMLIQCMHSFCCRCLKKYHENTAICPVCKTIPEKIQKNNYLELLVSHHNSEVREDMRETITE